MHECLSATELEATHPEFKKEISKRGEEFMKVSSLAVEQEPRRW